MPTTEEARDWLAHAIANDELAHYGVLGMHWGIRKDDVKGEPRVVKVSKNKDTELTTGDKVALGAGGIGAAVIYGGPEVVGRAQLLGLKKELDAIARNTSAIDKGKSFIDDVIDTSLPVKTVLHRVASTVETEIDRPKFATYLAEDVLQYRKNWSNLNIDKPFQRSYITRMQATKPITIASPESILRELEKGLHSVLDDGDTLVQKYAKLSNMAADDIAFWTDPKYQKDLVSLIAQNNKSAIWADDISKASAEILRKAGYAALTDVWDTDSIAKHAIIVIDNNAFTVTSKKLTLTHRVASGMATANITKNAGAYVQSVPTQKITAAISAIAKNKVAQRIVKTAVTRKL